MVSCFCINIHSQKYKIVYSGTASTDRCPPDPFLPGSTAKLTIIGVNAESSVLLSATCANPITVTNFTKIINFKPLKIITNFKSIPTNGNSENLTDIVNLNIANCDIWSSVDADFINTSIAIEPFNFQIEPVIDFENTSTSPNCIHYLFPNELGFESSIYTWEYFHAESLQWLELPSRFQGLAEFSIKLEDFFGVNAQLQISQIINFRIRFCDNRYTNIISRVFIPCSPNLTINPPTAIIQNICSDGQTGAVTFNFDRALGANEFFNMTMYKVTQTGNALVPQSYQVPQQASYTFDSATNSYKFNWSAGLEAGVYFLRYQTFDGSTTPAQETSVGQSLPFTITAPNPVTFSTTQENILCKGAATGKIIVTATGGFNVYKYQLNGGVWQDSNVFENLLSENNNIEIDYNILVKDSNDCVAPSGTKTVNLSEPTTKISFEPSSTSITHPNSPITNGSAGVMASGGTIRFNEPITYSWANATAPNIEIATGNTLNNQPAGSYICTATDANGCKAFITIDLVAYYANIQEIASINCFGQSSGSLRATIFGGTPPFIVPTSWTATSNNRVFEKSNLGPGNQDFNFIDYVGLSSQANYPLTAPNPISVTDVSTTNAKCFGESNGKINITVSGGTQFSNPLALYTFEWKNALGTIVSTVEDPDNLPVGSYICTIKDSKNCVYNLPSQTIGQPAVLEVNLALINPITPITVVGASTGGINISVSGGTPFANPLALYTFVWKNSSGTTIATTEDLINVPAGTYTVNVTDANSCATNPASISYTIDPPLPLTVNITRTGFPINCFGNITSLTANALGGSQPYPLNNYIWKKNNIIIPFTTQIINNQGAGIYQVQITDSNNNIANSSTFELTQPTAITASHTVTNINCFGDNTGKINLAVSGGLSSATYTFEWYKNGNLYPETTQNIQGLSAGTYKVFISNTENCQPETIIQNIIVNQPNAILSATISGINPTGFGLSNGSVNLTLPTGGTSPYTFLWNNNATSQNLSNVGAGNYSVTITDSKGCTISRNKILIQPNALTANVTLITKISCNGNNNDSLKAIPTDGISPYTYTWKRNGILIIGGNQQVLSNCISGNYSVLVIDANGNQTTANYFLDQPNALNVSFVTTPVPCNAGSIGTIAATVTGGTAPYSYAWSNGATVSSINNLAAGSYILEITDANDCEISSQAIVATTSNMIVNKTINNASCFGNCNGSIQVQISGGSGNYTINWNNLPSASGFSLNNLCKGNYSATITDTSANCSIPMSFSIDQPNALTLDLGADKTICAGQKTTINGKINIPNCTYSWTNNSGFTANTAEIEATAAGNYILTITTPENCTISDSILVTKLSESIKADFLVASQTYKDEDIILINLSNISTENYDWILPQQAMIIEETPQTVIMRFTETGSYNLKLKSTNTYGCEAFDTKLIIVQDNPGLPDASNGDSFIKEFTIYPNPSPNSGTFNVKVSLNSEASISLTLHEIALGTLINQTNLPSAKEHLKEYNLSLSAGVYWMILRTPMGVQTKKIIVN